MSSKLKAVVPFVGGAVVFLNIAFFVLSNAYFGDKSQFVPNVGEVPMFSDAEITSIRIAFVVFTLIVAIATVAAAIAPHPVGHAIMAVMAAASLAGGAGAALRGLPGVLAVTEIVLGAVLILLVVLSLQGHRAAWSFLVAIAAVYAIVLFFGAPKVRNVLGIGLWTTLVLPGLNVVALVSLILCRARYRR
jgi:hypothetical protein